MLCIDEERNELMNMHMMLARRGDECCQCENVANTNTNCQCDCDRTAAEKLGNGKIGIGNTSTMATFNKMLARGVAEMKKGKVMAKTTGFASLNMV